MDTPLVTMTEVVALTRLSKSEIYRRIRAGTFPAPVKLGGSQRIAFVKSEVCAWIGARISDRDERGRA